MARYRYLLRAGDLLFGAVQVPQVDYAVPLEIAYLRVGVAIRLSCGAMSSATAWAGCDQLLLVLEVLEEGVLRQEVLGPG